jgi:hypothetical protein
LRPLGFPWWGLLMTAGLLLGCPGLHAQSQTAGTYRCAAVSVDGRNGRCGSPPLILYPDGSYQIWGEEGTYTVRGDWLVLSQSRKRGRGRMRNGQEIVFDYTYRGRKYKVTFRRQDPVPLGSALI